MCARAENRPEQCWTALGAWPVEADVIDDAVRQTLLADGMYGEALAAASVLAGG